MQAFKVIAEGDEIGFLGEGGGPFIGATHSVLEHPHLKHVRFTSLEAVIEDEVAEVLVNTSSFAEAVQALEARGFALEAVVYEQVFRPAAEVAPSSPVARDEHESTKE